MYICDLSEVMDGLPCKEGCYCPAPICLLYINGANKLVPIAIQLKRTPGPGNPIFLPTDNWFDWMLAKMYYRSADAQVCIMHPSIFFQTYYGCILHSFHHCTLPVAYIVQWV